MGSPDPHDVPTLRDLIQRHTDRTGESRRALGDRSGMSHQTLGYWAAGSIKTIPDPETIRLFSRATSYTEQTVLLAAARTVGLRVSESGTQLSNSLPPGTDSLRPEDVDAIRAVIRQLVDARTESAGKVVDLARPPLPDFSQLAARHGESEGRRLVEQQDNDANNP